MKAKLLESKVIHNSFINMKGRSICSVDDLSGNDYMLTINYL